MQQTTPHAITLTNAALIKYTLFSLLFAAIILLTIILPAEYNIDPTGIGHKLGLTVFNKVEIETTVTNTPEKLIGESDVIEVIVPARGGVEYKFMMEKNKKLKYEWIADGAPLYFDLHGEPKGDTSGYFESYAIATVNEMKGSFTAFFTGSHGWYWKNETDTPVTVQLIATGEYMKHGLK